MFGIGSTELLVILIVALVVLGPKSLPGIAKTIGKVMGEFRRVNTEFQRTINLEVAQEEHEKRKKEAEEELFGKNSDEDARAEKSPEEGRQSTKTSPTVTPDMVEYNESDVQADAISGKHSLEKTPPSPLEDAVAKAEAEAVSLKASMGQHHEEPRVAKG